MAGARFQNRKGASWSTTCVMCSDVQLSIPAYQTPKAFHGSSPDTYQDVESSVKDIYVCILFSHFASIIRRISHQDRSMLGRRDAFGPGTRDHACQLPDTNVSMLLPGTCFHAPMVHIVLKSMTSLTKWLQHLVTVVILTSINHHINMGSAVERPDASTAHVHAARFERL